MPAQTITSLSYPDPPAQVDLTSSSKAGDLVSNGWTNATTYASNAVAQANALLSAMQTNAATLAGLPSVSGAIAGLTRTVGAFAAPSAPSAPANLAYNVPAAPVEPTLGNIDPLVQDAAPTFTAVMPSVNLNIPAPDALSLALPSAPALPAVSMPAAPAVALPSVPDLLGISVPTTPLLSIANFTAIDPASPQAASYTFAFTEPTYSSSLLDSLKARLLEMVNGASTGLNPTVEAAIWNRGRAREIVNAGRKAKDAVRNFAMRGFAKPPGALATELAQATQDAAAASSTINRDVMIKQAELEQENRKFAFDEAFKVESTMITYANQIAQRGFDAARYAQEAAIQLYQTNVQRYQADIQRYTAHVEQWRAAIQAELTKLDAFKAAIEAQQLIGQINTQAVDIYKTRVDAARSIVDIFRAQVEAANGQAAINKTTIEAYGAQVDAYGKAVQAKAAEYDGYATRVRAETAKIEGFRTQADAYGSQVSGFRALVDARVAAKDMEIKLGREIPMDLFRLRSEVFRTLNEAETARVAATADVFGKNVQLYSAQIEGQVGRMNAETGAYSAEAQYQRAVADNLVQVSQANVSAMMQKTGMLIEATRAGAQTAAQMAASALSAVNLTGSISASMSSTLSNSYGRNVGFNYSQSGSQSNVYTSSDNTNHVTTS
jgi:hypothetical protein